ncbi:MAG: Rrf2 family transcriptional regulator, partial [Syntrophaceae bacterium]|nr:Rrf2 family transcriptional regulator [Syntrophaceae bacterium]
MQLIKDKKDLIEVMTMLHLTRKGDYAIRGMVYLAGKPEGQIVLISEIASQVDVSQALLAKIFQQFSKFGLVNSYRGTGGGFILGRPPDKITLLEIVEAVEGPIVLNRCLINDGACDRDRFCTVHPVWKDVQDKMKAILASVTLKD